MDKIFVTGGGGFIGSHVVRLLLMEGYSLKVLLKPGESRKNLDDLDVEMVEGDILDPNLLIREMKGCRYLFHLAALYAVWLNDRRIMYRINVDGSRNVLLAAQHNNIEKTVYTSSIAAIGIKGKGELSDEGTAFNQINANDYVISKWLAEQEALSLAEYGLNVTIVNPAFPFGAGDLGPTPTGQIIVNLLSNRYPALFTGGFNAVDVADVAKGHILALKKGISGRKYILGNKNISISDFTKLIMKVAGIKRNIMTLPAPLMKGAGTFMEYIADNFTHKLPLVTGKEVAYSSQFLYFSNERAKKELGLEFTPIEKSIEASIKWFKDNGYIKYSKFPKIF